MSFLVTVVVPVFNALEFVEEAVNSVVNFLEVGEVILVEDGGSDGSFEKCKELECTLEKVRVLIHVDRQNKGVSASRNLGITEAKFPFIAFLDADDYFLGNRFEAFSNFIESNIHFDGIYEPIQYFNGSDKIYGVSKPISPAKLLHYLIRGTYGHFHTNGIIVRKEILLKSGLFIEELDLHQDSDLWLKLAFYGRLVSGRGFKPVSMVRRHEGNRIWKGTSNSSRLKQWRVTWNWAKNNPIGGLNKMLILRKLLKYKIGSLSE